MDGQFISTDIRYRELMNSRRRSTSYRKIKSPGGGGGRSKSVDVGANRGAVGTISEEVGGIDVEGVGVRGANALDDEVFAESTGDVGGAAVVGDVRGGGADIEQANTNSTDIEIATTYDGKNGVVVENEDVQGEVKWVLIEVVTGQYQDKE